MFKSDYTSCMEKISADAAWKERTLAAMQAAQAEAQPEAPTKTSATPQRSVKFSRKLLLTAAAIALLAVPSVYWYASTGGLGAKSAAPQEDGLTGGGVASSAAADTGVAMAQAQVAPETRMNDVPQDDSEAACAPGEAAFSMQAAAPRDEAQATEALLRGEAYSGDATETGGYETEGLIVLQCELVPADDAENTFGVPMYRFTVQYETSASAEKSDKSIRPDAELWVAAQGT